MNRSDCKSCNRFTLRWHSRSYKLTIWQSDNLTNLQYHNITISQSHNLQYHNITISQSHNLTILQTCGKGFNIILTNLTQYLLFEMDSNADLKGSFSQLQLVCLSPSREVVTSFECFSRWELHIPPLPPDRFFPQ